MKEAVHEILDAKITTHDKHRFEIKLDIDLPDTRVSSYRVESYFFVPKSLNVTPNTYGKAEFYANLQKYIRFKTPQIAVGRIADPGLSTSPLCRIRKSLADLAAGNPNNDAEKLFQEIKLLGVIIRGAVRDSVRIQLKEIEEVRARPTHAESIRSLSEILQLFLQDLDGLTAAIRDLEVEMKNSYVPKRIAEAYRFFDEYYSITLEDYLTVLLKGVRSLPVNIRESLDSIESRTARFIAVQQEHRRVMGFPSVIRKDGENSVFLYRRGVLKKFISSILHLQLEATEWEALSQVNFSIAAGIAMLFAAVVTVFAQNRFSTNSAIFIMIVVVSYMLKDRLKDWLKIILSKKMVRWVPDRRIRIRDPYSKKVIGYFKEAFSFVESDQVPREVLYRRNMDNITSIDEEGKPERVMKYEKQVVLYPKLISKFHERRRDINDIMRLDVSPWVRHADDPQVEQLYFDTAENVLTSLSCEKVYHLNIVFKYQTPDVTGRMKDDYDRIRMILDRDGIVHLGEVKV